MRHSSKKALRQFFGRIVVKIEGKRAKVQSWIEQLGLFDLMQWS